MEMAFVVWALGTLPGVFKGLGVVSFLLTMVCGFVWALATSYIIDSRNSKDNIKEAMLFGRVSKTVFCVCLPLWLFSLFVPDKETAYAMAAAYGVHTIAQDERTQKIAGQSVEVLEAFLAKTKKELETPVKSK